MDMSVAGDNDRWMLLQRMSGGGQPIVVRTRINPDIHDFAQSNQITAVICDVDPQLVNEQGMPLCMDALYDLEDRLVGLTKDSLKQAYHTASATGDARRTIYFTHSADLEMADLVASAPSDVATIWTTDELAFENYDEFISPTPLDVQIDGDHSVIASLEKHGDNGCTPRKINFWFYGDRSSLDDVASRLSKEGMFIDHWIDDERVGLVMSKTAPATQDHFRDLTPVILEASQSAGVEYDGWETSVLADLPAEPNRQAPKPFLQRLFGKHKN